MNEDISISFFIAFSLIPLLYAESQYECGAHGRFEYCIDGIPGCVIGCHCHPGYYFDTDTKICELNIKLSQDFRRQYYSEPTRVHVAAVTSPPEEQPITSNAVDEKIDEIAKDADDLGDWLYNQFFKTIENQVINKTQGEELSVPTRRSGSVLLNKPVRRSRKHWKGRKKKKKKSKSWKNKLLRITEDDSLFDSDSGSVSHDDESSSSSESDVSGSNNDKSKKKDGDDHGHKKIVIFNKKPQPPLPSFIFLPNMDTSYYPPIGLPPPPVMPMYPMVPVPPMLPGPQIGGPLFPYPGVPPKCEEDETTSSAATTDSTMTTMTTTDPMTTQRLTTTTLATSAETVPTSATVPTDKEQAHATAGAFTPTENTDTTTVENSPLRYRHKKRVKPIIRMNTRKGDPSNSMLMRENRKKQIFKKLREKLNRKNKLDNFFADQYQEPDGQYHEPVDPYHEPGDKYHEPSDQYHEPVNQYHEPGGQYYEPGKQYQMKYPQMGRHDPNRDVEFVPNRDLRQPSRIELPSPEDVDFKYLAELIHKADLNKTLNNRPNTTGIIAALPMRRNFNPINNINHNPVNTVTRQRSRMEDLNDSFYANLGKQIAAMIRKIDSVGDREVNIEIEKQNSKAQSQSSPVFNENNYASRSYWERSVRSPLKIMGSFRKEMDHLKHSNEDLFSIENKVEVAATTVPTLSLHDLESIISKVDEVQQLKPKRNNIYPTKSDSSNDSFKFNLLPGNIQTIQPISKPKLKQSSRNKDPVIIHELNPRRKQSYDDETFMISNFRQLSSDRNDPITNSGNEKDLILNMKPTRKPSAVINKPNEIAQPTHFLPNTTTPFFFASENRTNFKYQLRPVLLKHTSLNYNNQNQYQVGRALPIPYSGLTKGFVPYGKIDKPSYFHHEFHHFDYFDR